MAQRFGGTVKLDSKPRILSYAAVVGEKEGEGPIATAFDSILTKDDFGDLSWEKSESFILKKAIETSIEKAKLKNEQIDAIFTGDLLNQCVGSNFAVKDLQIPICGLFAACSTMALSLITASLAIESGGFSRCIGATSSHFCSAERQFRKPLEYGGQRTPTAQWTVTGAGSMILSDDADSSMPYIEGVHIGTIQDMGITDANNMGAAMAPAACKTISDFLSDTNTRPSDYDLILTGDLGKVGSILLKELLIKDHQIDISSVHNDCGLIIYDKEQDVHAGGSGCGCSASVLCSYIMQQFETKQLKNILFVATGALMSPTTALQGESILAVAHAVNIKGGKS